MVSIGIIKNKAYEKGGQCLSDEYINNRTKLLFKCKNNHEWKTTWKNINKGSWCPKCNIVYTIDFCKKIANDRFGKCLSERMENKLLWECNFGHQWKAKASNVIANNSWCPECSSGISERICRLFFEKIFNEQFPKSRPKWLKNHEGFQLELDGFSEKLQIAFEHNGIQHYQENKKFKHNFLKTFQNDIEKQLKCKENNIKLIIIPQLGKILKLNVLKTFIKNELIKNEIEIPKNFDLIDINLQDIHKSNSDLEFLKKIKDKALFKNAICLSDTYIGSNVKLKFKCNICKYVWWLSPDLMDKRWCPNCVLNEKRKTIEDAQNLANIKNGRCLSHDYKNNHTKLEWQCHLGHIWEASYNQIQSGNWCSVCFKQKRNKDKKISIDIYKKIAIQKNGICLSDNVNSCYDKLLWKCNVGHEWNARADQIKNTKQWCPTCARISKLKVRKI